MATRAEIINEILALQQHYSFRVVRSADDEERWLRDYVADLEEFTQEAIASACREYRRSGAGKFPGSGVLRKMAESHGATGARGERKPAVWRPLSDAEFSALSLDGKIRHHLILANECATKAGPMWENGRHKPIEAMPAEWHELRERSANHLAEARRLRELKQFKDGAA